MGGVCPQPQWNLCVESLFRQNERVERTFTVTHSHISDDYDFHWKNSPYFSFLEMERSPSSSQQFPLEISRRVIFIYGWLPLEWTEITLLGKRCSEASQHRAGWICGDRLAFSLHPKQHLFSLFSSYFLRVVWACGVLLVSLGSAGDTSRSLTLTSRFQPRRWNL